MEYKKYTDTSAGLYANNYPILSLSNDVFKDSDDPKFLLNDCIWYQCSSDKKRHEILDRFRVILTVVEDIKYIIAKKYPDLVIKHISIGGSYLFKDNARDIDFNIIVAGKHFSYDDVYDVEAINKKLSTQVAKVSLMVFGEEDFLLRTDTSDIIEVEDYIHTSLCMREGLVFPIRNVLICGHYWQPKKLDLENLRVRIKRQLYHAQLMLEKKVDLHRDDQARLSKSIGRITEAQLFLAYIFPGLKMPLEHILAKDKILRESLSRADIMSWLQEAYRNLTATKGVVLWLTGLSGSGKSSIGDRLSQILEAKGIPNQRLDGNLVKGCFGNTVNFGKDDHDFSIKIAAFVASILERQGNVVIASFVTPRKDQRDFLRNTFINYVEVYISTSMEICAKRNPKFVRDSSSYEIPNNPDIIVDGGELDIELSAQKILDYLSQ